LRQRSAAATESIPARGMSSPIVAGCFARAKIVDGWFRQLERLVRVANMRVNQYVAAD